MSGQARVVLDAVPRPAAFAAGDGSTGMMSGPHVRVATPPATMVIEQPRQILRLALKPQAPTTGYVDGAWWPRSRDLSTELPALFAAVAARLGRIQQVSYNLDVWDAAPRRLDIDGQRILLGGFRAQHPHTVNVIGLNGSRLILLVLPPATDQTIARQTLMTASGRDNIDGIDRLLTPTATVQPSRAANDLPDGSAMRRREVGGGRVHQRA